MYGREDWGIKGNEGLECVVKGGYKERGEKVVIVIDEYDGGLVDVVDEKENVVEVGLMMKKLYSGIK